MIILRILVRTVPMCVGTALAAMLLSVLDLWIVAMLVSVAAGIGSLSLGRGLLDGERDSTVLAAFGGLLIVAATGILSGTMIEQKPWPATVSGVALAEAGDHRWATTLQFRDGGVRPDLGGSAPIRGRYGHALDRAFVAPVVAADWTPEQRVVVWAVARDDNLAARQRLWQEPLRTGVAVSGFHVTDYLAAVGDARARHHLKAALDPVFVEWTADPTASLVAVWVTLATVAGVASLSLFVLFLAVWLLQ